MQSDHSQTKIKQQLNEDWLTVAHEILSGHLHAEISDLDQLLHKALNNIENGQTSASLRELSDKLNAKNKRYNDEDELPWVTALNKALADIPEQVLLAQSDDRFRFLPTDSWWIVLGKGIKRMSRGIQHGGRIATNPFRRLFKGTPKKAPVWKHEVPLKGLVQIHLLSLDKWCRIWDNQLRKIEAEVMVEADAWSLHSGGLVNYANGPDKIGDAHADEVVPDQQDIVAFFKEAKKQLEAYKEEYTAELDRHFKRIEEEITEAVSKTGTLEAPSFEYHTDEVGMAERRAKRIQDSDRRKWVGLFQVLNNRVELSGDFIRLQEQVEERMKGFSASLAEFFEQNLEHATRELQDELDEVISIYEESDAESLKELRSLSSEHRDKMQVQIEEQFLNPIREFTEEAVLSTRLDRFTSAIPQWAKDQPAKATLLISQDLGGMLPSFEKEEVDWQVLVQRVCNMYLSKPFMPKEVKPEQFLMELLQEMGEISQIIFTNLEIADEVKRSDEEDPLQVALEGLKRARIKLNELNARVVQKREDLLAKLSGNFKEAFSKLTMLLVKQDVNEMRLAGAEYMAKETAVDWQSRLTAHWARISDKVELFARFIWQKLKAYTNSIRSYLGFAEQEKLEGDKTDLAAFLSETDDQIAGLPFIYRRLFDFNKEVDERFYIRKPEQFERFKKGYELWQDQFPSTFAVVGEKGSGKSLFVKRLSEEVFTKHDTIHVNFGETMWTSAAVVEKIADCLKISEADGMEELIAAIKRKKKPLVVFLENIQHAYLRSISGMEAIEDLLMLISETNKEILWVVSSTRYGWNFMERVLDITDYFTHAVETDHLNARQIEEVILRRHRASGYQLKFLPDDSAQKSRNYKKRMDDEEEQQEFLKGRYFEKLAKLCDGNSSIAMIFWIRSIREYDDTHFYIDPFQFKAISRIDELDNEELFALTAFVLHDTLMPEHLARILNQSVSESKLMVSRLASRSILLPVEHGFMLNHLIYRQVVLVLKEANFIH